MGRPGHAGAPHTSRVDSGNQALGQAQIALRQLSSNAPDLAAHVATELQDDPGLVYDQVRWYRRKGFDAAARQLLLLHRVDEVQPDQFWQERGPLARGALNVGNPEEAYRLASEHGFTRGSEFADSEWLAGWIALRFLQRPEVASGALPDDVRKRDAPGQQGTWRLLDGARGGSHG